MVSLVRILQAELSAVNHTLGAINAECDAVLNEALILIHTHCFPDAFTSDLEQTLAGFHSVNMLSSQLSIALIDTVFGKEYTALFDPIFVQRALTSHLQV